MPLFRLRILRRRGVRGGVETHSEWLEAELSQKAVAQASAIAERILAGATGIAMLTTEREVLLWSRRQNMPKPVMLGGA